ncbi:hypothetical protein HK097_006126 [Rhizophlyctis rosea]|uniref:Pentatricopeptide repeat-containing protein-mitochondrial domain-containing protein n=1 Tax=Rhizophlyctis rosea TaxID=64517 RepID=A0AAD5X5U7_9FUNG|nr:hypothetical protein HK097_006126 [Rhizophlyctis rosea]
MQVFTPQALSLQYLADVHSRYSSLEETQTAVAEVVNSLGYMHPRTVQTLLRAYNRLEDPVGAVKLLRSFRGKDGVRLDDQNYSYILRICRKHCSSSDLLKLYREFRDESWTPTQFTFQELIASCVDNRNMNLLKEVIKERETAGLPSSIQAESKILDAVIKTGRNVDSLQFLSDLRTRGICPDIHTYGSLISHAIKQNNQEVVDTLFKQLDEDGLVPSQSFGVLVMVAFAVVGSGKQADEYITVLKNQGVALTSRMYASLIDAHATAGDTWSAEMAFHIMVQRGVVPTARCYEGLAKAYMKEGAADTISDLIDRMRGEGVSVNSGIYCKLFEGLWRGGVLLFL